MSRITIVDLEVFYRVGVTNEERAKPQRLLVTLDMNFDFSSAAVSDRIEKGDMLAWSTWRERAR